MFPENTCNITFVTTRLRILEEMLDPCISLFPFLARDAGFQLSRHQLRCFYTKHNKPLLKVGGEHTPICFGQPPYVPFPLELYNADNGVRMDPHPNHLPRYHSSESPRISLTPDPLPKPHLFPSRIDTSQQSGSSHFRALFESALQGYQTQTGITLSEHPLTIKL